MRDNLRALLLLSFMFLSVQMTYAQITVQGKISDSNSESLIGANVLVKGTTIGAVSNIDGQYSIQIASNTAVLVFSYTGFASKEVEVSSSNANLDVVLESNYDLLNEVIVTAYGTTEKGSFTGSAAQINAEQLENRALTNITSAIEGVAGIQFSAADGQPGASTDIRVRGFGSVNASSSPLYVLDGIIFSGSLNSINPNDVESVTVLKDAASTALYGSKAANGVVMITTKQGKSGQAKFTLNVSQGASSRFIDEYDRVSAEEYYPLLWEARRNSLSISGSTPETEANQRASNEIFGLLGTNPFNVANDQIVGTDGKLNPSASLLYADDLNWQDQLTRSGSRTNVDLTYQGGTNKTNYFASLGYLDDVGWILNSDFKRISGRVNIATQPQDWIKTGINIASSTTSSNQAADGGSTSFVNPFFSTRRIAPIYPVHLHDPVSGAFIFDDSGNKIYDLGADRVGNSNGRHAIQETILNVDNDKIFSVGGRAYVDLYFLNDFTFTFNASLDKRFFNNVDYENPIVGDGAPAGRAGRTATTRTSVSYNQLLNYSKDFDRHTISALIGHESFDYEVNSLQGNRIGLIADGNTELLNFTTTSNLTSFSDRYSTEGYLGRIEYDYDDKYFLSTSARRDGSSRFAEETRWGNFWSFGAAWRLDNEQFISSTSWINLLKLRASYGQVGNDSNLSQAISFYASQALFALNNNNASEPGILISTLASSDLEWEENTQSDVALEFTLFDYKINGSIEYYNRETDNLLFEVPLPLSSGIDDVNRNIGTMFNRGIEVNVSADVIQTDDFRLTLSANASTIKNEFTKLPQEEIINGSKKLVVGGSIYDYWLRDWYGVDPADGSGLYILDEEVDPSDASVRTIDGVLVTTDQNDAKMDFVGTAIPDLFGSFTTGFTFKNFKLGALFTYQIGGKTYDTNWAGLMSAGAYGNAYSSEILDRWQKPGDITNIPRLDVSQTSAFGAGSDRWLVSSSYFALRSLNASYELPEVLLRTIGINGLRIYANAENLFINTERKGMYINQNFNGTTQNVFTPSRVLTVGLNASF